MNHVDNEKIWTMEKTAHFLVASLKFRGEECVFVGTLNVKSKIVFLKMKPKSVQFISIRKISDSRGKTNLKMSMSN